MTVNIGFEPTQCACAHDMSNRLISSPTLRVRGIYRATSSTEVATLGFWRKVFISVMLILVLVLKDIFQVLVLVLVLVGQVRVLVV